MIGLSFRLTAFALPSLFSTLAAAQSIDITPKRVFLDEAAIVRVTGLQPNETVTLVGALVDGAGQTWTSEAQFTADMVGAIDLSKQAPLSGSYGGVSAAGLIWSMKPAEKKTVAYRAPKDFGPQTIGFRVLRGGQSIAAASLEQDTGGQGVHQIKVEGRIHGILFVPSATGRHPGILVLGGSEGGLPARRAMWLAQHGYVAFALAYFRYENLPAQLQAIPLEYFGEALSWMRTRPEVVPDELAVLGTSRGGELALQLAAMFPIVKAVVAYVPANTRHPACCGQNVRPYAWTWKNMPLAFARSNEGGSKALAAAIDVENTSGPILMVGGGNDGVWDSSGMVRQAADRLKRMHFSHPVVVLLYPHAGHSAGRPEICPAWHGHLQHPVSGRPTNPGGTPEANALSSLDAIPKVLAFLHSALAGS